MTTIASLGLQIDSGDAVEAKDNLDQLTDAGKRSEESAGRTGRAWETALGSLQGDTRQIVQELQSLNANCGPRRCQCFDRIQQRCSEHGLFPG